MQAAKHVYDGSRHRRATGATRTRGGFLSFGMGTEPGALWARALFRSAGLRVTARPGHEIYICQKE